MDVRADMDRLHGRPALPERSEGYSAERVANRQTVRDVAAHPEFDRATRIQAALRVGVQARKPDALVRRDPARGIGRQRSTSRRDRGGCGPKEVAAVDAWHGSDFSRACRAEVARKPRMRSETLGFQARTARCAANVLAPTVLADP